MQAKDYVEAILQQNTRLTSRAISLVENENGIAVEILKQIHPHTGKAKLVGITGSPGAGKSTITDKLAKYLRTKDYKVGIIAIDPTSPFTGGAILGDRIRMQELATDPGVFIRSMGTRGQLGGLSKSTISAVKILDAYGCDYIFIETVGVGQSEVDIIKLADTVVIVTIPGMGDDIQAIKAGIMEIGDIFDINKSDRDGADRLKLELETMLDLKGDFGVWRPPVMKTIAQTGEGVSELMDTVDLHLKTLDESGELKNRRLNNIKIQITNILFDNLSRRIQTVAGKSGLMDSYAENILDLKTDPFTVSEAIMKEL